MRTLRWNWVVSTLLAAPLYAGMFDHSAYDDLLRRYVDEQGMVDYAGVRDNAMSGLESYLERLAAADMAGWPAKERLAFWINAYNAHALHLIAQKPEMKKVSEDFGLFNKPLQVAGLTISLSDIEHRILRGTKNPDNQQGPIADVSFETVDPRIHFALVCGAVSCPRLLNKSYRPEPIDTQLTLNAVEFVNNPRNIQASNGHLKLSSIFKWYRNDFANVGGVGPYLTELLDPEKRADVETLKTLLAGDLKKAEYTYDWTVNEALKRPDD